MIYVHYIAIEIVTGVSVKIIRMCFILCFTVRESRLVYEIGNAMSNVCLLCYLDFL